MLRLWITLCLLTGCIFRAFAEPNIVVILADDLGYGDLKCYQPEGKIPTPHLDRMASEGMRFTDAHSASAVCTPTRYALLTGRYCWRTRLKKGVLGGWSPHLLEDGRLTAASMLKQRGYVTACIGKWHLGMDWPAQGGGLGDDIAPVKDWKSIDFSKPVTHGPTSNGFDSYFGIAASLDMPPFAFIRNDRLTGELTATRTYLRTGPATPGFEAEKVILELVREACTFVRARAADGKPFFLYLPLTSPHTPVAPSEKWKAKSPIGPYGDFVMETDHAAGEVLTALRDSALDRNTLVIFTSDNGATPNNIKKAADGTVPHRSNAPWRGAKSDIFEGGHRIPFIVRWPGTTPAGSVCREPVCLNTLITTAAEFTGLPLPAGAGPDSFSIAPLLRGEKPDKPTHPFIIHHSIEGLFAIRKGDWKYIDGPGSGGWSKDPPVTTPGQLYNLADDSGEEQNLYARAPEKVAELQALLKECRARN
ncbi:MAG TPA: arylsulfatase [Verrucomicrobiales bacterium]|nr:arylsulfatase [Verrucomicrobiales bacterium]